MYGFNPAQLGQANQNLTAMQNQIANLPTAANQMSNYSGATAGQSANLYNNLLGNMQPGLTNANNTVSNMMNEVSATQNQANQQATLGYQGEQLNVSALQDLVQNALAGQGYAQGQEQNALTQQSNYGNYVTSEQQAQAAQTNAAANMKSATASAAQTNQQVAMVNQLSSTLSSLYGGKPQEYAQALIQMLSGNTNVTLPGISGGGMSVGTANPGSLGMSMNPQSTGGVQTAMGGLQ
jgi:hypothetical protein